MAILAAIIIVAFGVALAPMARVVLFILGLFILAGIFGVMFG